MVLDTSLSGQHERRPRVHQPCPRTPGAVYSDSAIYGDPVQVSGESVPLSAADGDISDWAIGGSKWLTLSGGTAAR